MVKKLLRIATTFGALVAGYFGYALGFSVVLGLVRAPQGVPNLDDRFERSVSAQEARKLALTGFGPGHWSIDAKIQYYDTYRHYWIFAQEYERRDEGKIWVLKPFALIWMNRHGEAIKTLTADMATLKFTSSPDFVRPGDEPAHVGWAELKGRVWLRDDKGTPADLGDDLTIGELDSLVFSEKENTITSDSPVVIRDRDTMATADSGVKITLRPRPGAVPGSAAGYEGARSIHLLGAIKVTSEDVGRTGVVPGGATRPARPDAPKEPRPGEITCDDGLLIDLPAPRIQPVVGPPAPQGPTFALFTKNVQVRQGDAQAPEQLNSNKLHLTFVPADKTNRTTEAADGGPVSDLTLQRARATGPAVWLQSKAEHVVGYGNELIYTRNAPAGPDTSYFRGAKYTEIRKENPSDGTIDVIRTYDLTIYHDGPNSSVATVIAGGPGWLQSRRQSTHEVLRSASWQTRLLLQPVENDPTRRQLTLEGQPKVSDPLQGDLQASQVIVAILSEKADAATPSKDEPPKPATETAARKDRTVILASDSSPLPASASEAQEPAEAKPDEARGSLAGGSYRLELVRAWRDVQLVTKGPLKGFDAEAGGSKVPDKPEPPSSKRTIHARELLVAHFAERPAPETPAEDTPTPAPTVTAEAPKPEALTKPAEKKPEAPRPPDPPLDVQADRIWAWIDQEPGAKSKGEVREVRLRGDVKVHQDPAADQSRGFDVGGERVDLLGRGDKLFEVRAYAEPGKLARVATDTFEIEGSVLGLDQVRSYAVAIGPGKLVQHEAGGGLLGDALPDADALVVQTRGNAARPADPKTKTEARESKKLEKKKGPLSISWGWDDDGRPLLDEEGRPVETWMKFFGKTVEEGRPGPAKAIFYNGVRAWTEESVLQCGQMQAYLDGPVDFRNAKGLGHKADPPQGGQKADDAPRARVEWIVCEKDVRVHSIERDPEGRVKEERRVRSEVLTFEKSTEVFECEQNVEVISTRFLETGPVKEKFAARGDDLIYNKATGDFWIDSAGNVDLYSRGTTTQTGDAATPFAEGGRQIRPASDHPNRRAATAAKLKPLELTRIWFSKQMNGELGSRTEGQKRTAGQAEFFGNVRTMHAIVPDADATLDPDHPPADFHYTRSNKLRVISEPPPSNAKDQADHILIDAWENVYGLIGRPPAQRTAIRADDHMTFDSATGVSYIYGGPGGVLIVDQSGTGQPASFGSGSVVMFNRKTGQHRIVDPRSVQFINPDGGLRAGKPSPETEKKPEKKKRQAFPRIGPSSKERRNFTGR